MRDYVPVCIDRNESNSGNTFKHGAGLASPHKACAGHASVGGNLNSLRSSSLRRLTRETHVHAPGLSSPSAALSSPSPGAAGRAGEAMSVRWGPLAAGGVLKKTLCLTSRWRKTL